jgi:hypothetical protein
MLTQAETRFLETRERILARRNPEQLAREDAEFQGMTDAELAAEIARLPWSTNKSTRYRRLWTGSREYVGAACLLLSGLAIDRFDSNAHSTLSIPLGPLLLALALSRWRWGRRAAMIVFAPMLVIAIVQYFQLISQGEFPIWGICTMLAATIIARARCDGQPYEPPRGLRQKLALE